MVFPNPLAVLSPVGRLQLLLFTTRACTVLKTPRSGAEPPHLPKGGANFPPRKGWAKYRKRRENCSRSGRREAKRLGSVAPPILEVRSVFSRRIWMNFRGSHFFLSVLILLNLRINILVLYNYKKLINSDRTPPYFREKNVNKSN